ncbi:MAG: response regulator [Pseudomonadota bacterium]|nr:response regulator [Campylobacterota bacterium]MEA1921036.1 response regulator [Pseudomonadota bacterium]
MSKKTIVVVEDEVDIREVLIYNMEREGYQVFGAADGVKGLKMIQEKNPDLVLLDLMLPGLDGLQICKQLKDSSATQQIPIVMVSARSSESDIVLGLELGADDYVTKPFSPRELLARVRAVLRRQSDSPVESSTGRLINCEGVIIDARRHEVKVDGLVVNLTATEFKLIHYLAQHPGWVFTRDQLMGKVMGQDNFVIDRNIDVHIQAVRKKLGSHRDLIETIRGIGYRFKNLNE